MYVDEQRLESFMTEFPIIRKQSIDLEYKSLEWWFLFDKNLRHVRVNALVFACIHWDILLDYDEISDEINASK